VALPFIVNFLLYERFIMFKLILGAMGMTMLYAFLLTGSRGGFIGLAVISFVLARKRVGSLIGGVLLVVLLAAILTFAPDYTVERLKTASPYEGTGAGRLELWYQGWRMFLSNPILGVGKGNFAELSETHHVAHNSFVHIAAEIGLPGIIVWIGLFYFSFKALIGARRIYAEEGEKTRIHVLADSLMVGTIGFISTAFFLSRQYEYLPYILIALSVALYQVASREKGLRLSITMGEMVRVSLVTLAFFVAWVGMIKVFL